MWLAGMSYDVIRCHGEWALAYASPFPPLTEPTLYIQCSRVPCSLTAAAAAKSLQLCPTLCKPTDSAVPGILQARTLEWVAISFSNAWKWKVKVKSLSRVRLFAIPWTAAHQAPPPMGSSRQEYWSGVPLTLPHIFDQSWIQTKMEKKINKSELLFLNFFSHALQSS